MHPSWRDLVIEHLMNSEGERQRFLGHSGAPGLLLALSSEGGAEGQRAFPLLQRDADWECLRGRLREVLPAASTYQRSAILSSIRNAMRVAMAADSDQLKAHLTTCAAETLDACRAHWDTAGTSIPVADLERYYQISEQLRPLPPSPDLEPTWAGHQPPIRTEEDDDLLSDTEETALKLWFRLVQLIEKNEPRFLRQIDFPHGFMNALISVFHFVEYEVQAHVSGDLDYDFEDGEDRWDTLASGLQLVSSWLPGLRERADQLDTELTDLVGDKERESEERWADVDPEDYLRPEPDEEFDVDAVFVDL